MENLFQDQQILSKLVTSIILLIVLTLFRWITVNSINRVWDTNAQLKKRWMTHTRNIQLAILIIGLVIVWASELQNFAISLVAVAAAIVIATKELIMCITGGLLKATSKPFKIGDRIQIADFRGDVVDHNMLTTTLNEIGPGQLFHQYTGKKIILPNSLFLSQSVVVQPGTQKFTIHTFSIPQSSEEPILELKKRLQKAAEKVSSHYIEEAMAYFKRLEQDVDIELPNSQPRVSVSVYDEKRVDYVVRLPVPSKRAGKIEQEIIQSFFEN